MGKNFQQKGEQKTSLIDSGSIETDGRKVLSDTRRSLLKSSLISGVAGYAISTNGLKLTAWHKPIITSTILPAHAQTSSPGGGSSGGTTTTDPTLGTTTTTTTTTTLAAPTFSIACSGTVTGLGDLGVQARDFLPINVNGIRVNMNAQLSSADGGVVNGVMVNIDIEVVPSGTLRSFQAVTQSFMGFNGLIQFANAEMEIPFTQNDSSVNVTVSFGGASDTCPADIEISR